MTPAAPSKRIAVLEMLDPRAERAMAKLVELLAGERAPTSVRDPESSWRVHVADSLSGIAPGMLGGAETIADIGAGAGFPGLVLAAALPDAEVELIESIGRKCEFMEEAIGICGITNAKVVCERSEEWASDGGRERYDAAVARAVGRLATLAELASPLLQDQGSLVCWKGRRNRAEEEELDRASERVAMEPVAIREVGPYAGSQNRHIHLLRKNGPTPDELPRRPGMAKKKPFGAERARGSRSKR